MTLGQDNQQQVRVRQAIFFPYLPQQIYAPYAPYGYPAVAPMTFTFEVMTERVASTDSRSFGTWGEALAHAQALFTSTRGATRVVVTDQRGTRRTYPGGAPYAAYPDRYAFAPYPYQLFTTPTTISRTVTVAGLGQAPAFELFEGLQMFPQKLADSIATNLAAMIWVPTSTSAYTAYSPGSYEVNFGAPPPAAPGYPGEATAPGAWVLANPATVAPVDALSAGRPLDKIDIVVANNREEALVLAAPGEDYGIVLVPAPSATQEKRKISPAAIAAGIAAAAIAAILVFS